MSAIIPYATSALGKRAAATLLAYKTNKAVRRAVASTAGTMARRAANMAARRIQRGWKARSKRSRAIRSNRRVASRGYVKRVVRSAETVRSRYDSLVGLFPTNTLINCNGSNEHVLGDITRGDFSNQREANRICLKGLHIRCYFLNGTAYTAAGLNNTPTYVRMMLIGRRHTAGASDGVRMYSPSGVAGAISAPQDYSAITIQGWYKAGIPLDRKEYKIYWEKRYRLAGEGETGRAPPYKYVNKFIKFRNKKFTWMTNDNDAVGTGQIFPDMRLLFEIQRDDYETVEQTVESQVHFTSYFCT